MNFKIKFIPKAHDTFLLLAEQLEQRWGYQFVTRLEGKVATVISALQVNPYLYQIVDAGTETRKCVLHKTCSMFYKVQNDDVLIICFSDNRQDPLFL